MFTNSAEQLQTLGANSDSTDARQKNIARLEELLSDGQKKLILRDADSAVDLLSDAARLSEVIYGTFAPGTFTAHMQYGRALVHWASDQYPVFKLKTKDEAESSDEETEDEEEAEIDEEQEDQEEHAGPSEENPTNNGKTTEATEIAENGNTPSGEQNEEEDVIGSPEAEELDEFDSILKDAWSVLEVAKKTCERQLQNATNDIEIRQWKLNLSEAIYYLGQVMILSDRPEEAKTELLNSLEIKQQYLSADNRDLAGTLFNIAKSLEEMKKYDEARIYFEKALETLNKKMASLQATKDSKESADEIVELQEICSDLREKVENMIESAISVAKVKEEQQKATTSTASNNNNAPFSDISDLIKRRHPEESEDLDAKKSKTE